MIDIILIKSEYEILVLIIVLFNFKSDTYYSCKVIHTLQCTYI